MSNDDIVDAEIVDEKPPTTPAPVHLTSEPSPAATGKKRKKLKRAIAKAKAAAEDARVEADVALAAAKRAEAAAEEARRIDAVQRTTWTAIIVGTAVALFVFITLLVEHVNVIVATQFGLAFGIVALLIMRGIRHRWPSQRSTRPGRRRKPSHRAAEHEGEA